MKDRKYLPIVLLMSLIVFSSLVPRFYKVDNPILVYHPWRQCDTAAIARNIYRSDLDIFHPQIDTNGNLPSVVECEFQIYGFIVSLFYTVFGVKEVIGRIVSIAFYIGTTVALGWIAYRINGIVMTLWALFFLGFTPISIIVSRSFQPDYAMLCFLMSAVALFWRYLDSCEAFRTGERPETDGGLKVNEGQNKDRWCRFYGLMAAVFLGMALLTKLVAAYAGFVFMALAISYRGKKAFVDKDIISIALAGILPSIAWYSYASTFPVSFNVWGLGPQKLSNWLGWMNSGYYKAFNDFFIGMALTPPLFVLVLISIPVLVYSFVRMGSFSTLRSHSRPFMAVWLVASLMYMALTSRHVTLHSYYNLPVIPCFVILGAWLLSLLHGRYGVRLTIVLVIVLVPMTVWFSWGKVYPGMYHLSDYPLRMLKLSKIISKTTASDDLVLTSLGPSLPEVLYYSDRKGWHIDLKKATVGELRNYRKKGARWFAWLQPNINGFLSSYRRGISLQSLLGYLQSKNIDVNYCLGDGLGFCGIINLESELNDDLDDSKNILEITGKTLLRTIVTGQELEFITSHLQIDAFILPYRKFTDNPQKILDVLSKHSQWRLVHFNDDGLVYLKNTVYLSSVIENMEYSLIDPVNTNGNYCVSKTPDNEMIEACVREAERAHEIRPHSWKAASVLGYFYILTKSFKKGVILFDNPVFREKVPQASRINHAICLLHSGRKDEAREVISYVVEKWPANGLAAQVRNLCK